MATEQIKHSTNILTFKRPNVFANEARDALFTLISYLDANPPTDTDMDYISTLGMLLNHIDQDLVNTAGTSILYIMQEPTPQDTGMQQENETSLFQQGNEQIDTENVIHISSDHLNNISTDEVNDVESCLQRAISVSGASNLTELDGKEVHWISNVDNVCAQDAPVYNDIVNLLNANQGMSAENETLIFTNDLDGTSLNRENEKASSNEIKCERDELPLKEYENVDQERENKMSTRSVDEIDINTGTCSENVSEKGGIRAEHDYHNSGNIIHKDEDIAIKVGVIESTLKYHMTTRSSPTKQGNKAIKHEEEINNETVMETENCSTGLVNINAENNLASLEPLETDKTSARPNKWECPGCDKSFRGENILKKHMMVQDHGGVETNQIKREKHTCVDCGKVFASLGLHNKHIKCHGPKTMKCPKCDKYFARKHNLNNHLKIHEGERPHVCEICDKRFLLKANLKIHLKTHVNGKKYSCEVCGKKFKALSSVKIHMGLHSGNTPYMCNWCGKSYLTSSHLKEHIRTQHEGHTFECKDCGKKYSCRSAFTLHQKLHSDETPYKCSICEASFKTKPRLNYHVMKHQGERLFRCEICEKRYHTVGNLKSHLKIHSGVKAHSCSICKKSFVHAHDMRKHELTHGREQKNICLECGRCFKTSSQLRFHASSHKPKKSNSPMLIQGVDNYVVLGEVVIP